jgi:zinc and cadmium transporter
MALWLYALAAVSTISLLSLCGVAAIPVRKQTIDKVLFYLVSLATGAMLGNAIVHLMPESFENANPMTASILIVAGFLFSFLMEKVLNLRCHHSAGGHCHAAHGACAADDDHDDDHDEKAFHAPNGHIHHTGWMSLVSHGMDNFMDGVLIGVSFLVSVPTGIATTVAIVLHEIPMEFGGFGILINAGFSRWGAILVNFSSGIVAMLGTVLTLWLGSSVQGLSAYLTPVCAGIVFYITAAGLVPQLQKETNPRRSLVQFVVMLVGIAAMVAVKFLD